MYKLRKSRQRGGLGIMVITRDCGSRNTGSIPVGHPDVDFKKPTSRLVFLVVFWYNICDPARNRT